MNSTWLYIFCIDYSGGLIFCVQPEVRRSLFSFIPCRKESSWITIRETDTLHTVSAGSECMFPSASRSSSLLEVITSAANASICLVLRFQPLIRSSHAHWAGPELNALSSCQDHRVFRGINEYAVIHTHICMSTPTEGGDTLAHGHGDTGGCSSRIKILEFQQARSTRDLCPHPLLCSIIN